jgi:hypothetical protein
MAKYCFLRSAWSAPEGCILWPSALHCDFYDVDFLQLIGEDYTNSSQLECRNVSQEVEEVRLLLLLFA